MNISSVILDFQSNGQQVSGDNAENLMHTLLDKPDYFWIEFYEFRFCLSRPHNGYMIISWIILKHFAYSLTESFVEVNKQV